jgi:hypothetical protein
VAIYAKSDAGTVVAARSVSATPVTLHGLSIAYPVTAGVSTITLWNNAAGAAAGTILWQKTIPVQAVAATLDFNFPTSLRATVGISVTIATTAADGITFWLN